MVGDHPTFRELGDLFHGAPAADRAELLRSHVDACAACKDVMQRLEAEAAVLKAACTLAVEDADPDALDAILGGTTRKPGRRSHSARAFSRRSRERRHGHAAAAWSVPAAIGVAAAATIFAALSLWAGLRPAPERDRSATAPRRGGEDVESPFADGRAGVAVPPETGLPVRIVSVDGEVETAQAGSGRWLKAREGSLLGALDELRTDRSRACIRFESGTLVFINHSTRIMLPERSRPSPLSLAAGEVLVETAPAEPGFVVESPHGRAVALGTRFGVESTAAGTRILVVSGRVRASTERGVADVEAGREVLLASVTAAPGEVHPARDLARRLAWTDALSPEARRARLRGLVALYEFREGGGDLVRDSSGVGRPLNLRIRRPASVVWLRGGGLNVRAPAVITSGLPATKITDACAASGEFTVETWVRPHLDEAIGPGRIVTLSIDPSIRNFTLGQGSGHPERPAESRYVLRVTTTGAWSSTATPSGAPKGELLHLVATRSKGGEVSIYLNGRRAVRERHAGGLSGWRRDCTFTLANEPIGNELGDRPWLGEYRLVAVYDRALTADEVRRLFRMRPRER